VVVAQMGIATVVVMCVAAGCIPFPATMTGPSLPQETIAKIQPGKTTKAEVLEWLGPPITIGAKGEIVAVLRPTEWIKHNVLLGGSRDTEVATWFELFAPKRETSDYHRVYYYYRAVTTRFDVPFPGMFVFDDTTIHDQLWILMNEETGIVEDYVLRRK